MYTIVVSAFEAGIEGVFELSVRSGVEGVKLGSIGAEDAGMLRRELGVVRFGGGDGEGRERWLVPITPSRVGRVVVTVRQSTSHTHSSNTSRTQPPLSTRASLQRGLGPGREVVGCSGEGGYSDVGAGMGIRTADVDVAPVGSGGRGWWVVVERMGGGVGVGEVEVGLLSEVPVGVGVWGVGEG